MAYNKKGYAQRAKILQELTDLHYEPERQDRCKAAIWRIYVERQFGICYLTYLKYLQYQPEKEDPPQEFEQLTLFD